MRKNRTMRVAALLLALTLITSCFVGGTFAKYSSGNSAETKARVAYWGFSENAELSIEDLFDTSDDTGIQTIEGTNLIAPGSEGEVTFSMVTNEETTNPEVAYKVHVDTDTSNVDEALDAALTYTYNDQEYDTWAETVKALVASLSGVDADDIDLYEDSQFNAHYEVEAYYEPGVEVPEGLQNEAEHTIGWSWAFKRDADAADTALGNAVDINGESIHLFIDVHVEQTDVNES